MTIAEMLARNPDRDWHLPQGWCLAEVPRFGPRPVLIANIKFFAANPDMANDFFKGWQDWEVIHEYCDEDGKAVEKL